jgi:riboflavin synthase
VFTGIIQTTGRIDRRTASGGAGARLAISTPRPLPGLAIGESIGVNGACLTVVSRQGRRFTVDVSPETLKRTTLGRLAPRTRVNLERALRMGDRLGGHIVQGHVDGVGEVVRAAPDLQVRMPRELLRYVVEKGSIAIDGVSLTVVDVLDDGFTVAIIPHTLEVTTLGRRPQGDAVNLEVDVTVKYVERLLAWKDL